MKNQTAITRHPSLDRDYAKQRHPWITTPTGGLMLTGLIGAGLWLSAVAIVGMDGFFDHHDFALRTPLILQTPLVVTAIASESSAGLSAKPLLLRMPLLEGSDPEPASEQDARSVDPIERDPGSGVVTIIRKVFGRDAEMAIAIAKAESGLDCTKTSNTNDAGVMQVNLPLHAWRFGGADPYSCTANILVAKQIFDESGWNAWVAYTTGAHKKYLGGAL